MLLPTILTQQIVLLEILCTNDPLDYLLGMSKITAITTKLLSVQCLKHFILIELYQIEVIVFNILRKKVNLENSCVRFTCIEH